MTAPYLARLAARTAATRTVLCVGLDPDPDSLPPGFAPDLAGVEAFSRLLLEAALPHAAAIKPNLAFFEAHGSAGIAALERLRALVPADVPFVADAKRGDIGTTAARQAIALFDTLGADAVTVNPYLGEEAVGPLLDRTDRFAYVLGRTSNPGAGELQDLPVAADPAAGHPAEPLWARVARRVATWGPGGTVGLVVGATAPAEGPATALPAGAGAGGGLLVNVSRGIALAAGQSSGQDARNDPGERLSAAAAGWAARLAVLP